MDIYLVRHEKVGIGYAVKYEHKKILKVRFMGSIDLPITFPLDSFEKGRLVDLGVVDSTEKNPLFS